MPNGQVSTGWAGKTACTAPIFSQEDSGAPCESASTPVVHVATMATTAMKTARFFNWFRSIFQIRIVLASWTKIRQFSKLGPRLMQSSRTMSSHIVLYIRWLSSAADYYPIRSIYYVYIPVPIAKLPVICFSKSVGWQMAFVPFLFFCFNISAAGIYKNDEKRGDYIPNVYRKKTTSVSPLSLWRPANPNSNKCFWFLFYLTASNVGRK